MITDVPGVLVGHHERLGDGWATGTTVVLVPEGAVGAVDQRGGAPGTRETNLLEPENLVQRVNAGCPVMGLRYKSDPAVGKRFETLRRELGDGFIAVELEGKGHSVVTEHRDEESVQKVLAFFRERLKA